MANPELEIVEQRPNYLVVEWTRKAGLIWDEKYYYCCSPRFEFLNELWQLTFNLNSCGWLSLYLEGVKNSYKPELSVCCTLGLKAADGTLHKSNRATHYFAPLTSGFSWFQVMKREELASQSSKLCPNGRITVYCELRLDEKCQPAVQCQKTLQCDDKPKKKVPFNEIMKKVVFVLSGFVNPLRSEIRDKAWEMGAKYKGDWDDSCTHLVCAFLDTPKYVQVRGKDGIVVTKHWINDCYEKKTLLPWRSYMLGKYDKDTSGETDDTDEDSVGVKNQININDNTILAEDLSNIYLKQHLCDVTINVGGREFQAHRSILAARSSVFASMFEHNMTERKSGVVKIDDCDPDTFHDFLLYLYTAKVDMISPKNAIALYCIADKYDLSHLTTSCEQFLLTNLSMDLFFDVLLLAITYNKSTLIEGTQDFFAEYTEEILVTEKWQHFLKENSIVANELLIKSVQAYKRRRIC